MKEVEIFYEAVVETDGRIRLKASVLREKGLKALVAVPRNQAE